MKLSIYIEYSVCCDKCGRRDTTDLKSATRFFKKQGWIAVKEETFCPKCAAEQKIIEF